MELPLRWNESEPVTLTSSEAAHHALVLPYSSLQEGTAPTASPPPALFAGTAPTSSPPPPPALFALVEVHDESTGKRWYELRPTITTTAKQTSTATTRTGVPPDHSIGATRSHPQTSTTTTAVEEGEEEDDIVFHAV